MFWLLKYLLYFTGSSITLSTGLASYLAFLQPSFYFPQPTGKYAVGTTTYHWVDEKRKASTQDSAAGKELMVQVWYPSSNDRTTQKPVAPYAPYVIDHYKKNQKIAWLLALSRPMYTYAVQDALLIGDEQKFPVIIFSHGLGCTRNHNTAHCEELASRGYVVVGISHSYGSGVVQFPDGRINAFDPVELQQQCIQDPMNNLKTLNNNIDIWVDDVQMVLDNLEQLNANSTSPFYNRFNMDKIGMFGHSYGGAAAVQLCRREPRIKAGVNMDGSIKAGVSVDGRLLGSNPTEQFDKPFMFLLAQSMTQADMLKQIKQSGIKEEYVEEFCTATYQSHLPAIDILMEAIGHDVYKLTIKDTEHLAFCDMALIKEAALLSRLFKNLGAGSLNGYRTMEIVNAHLVAFFDKYLKGIPSVMLDTNQSIYPEVEFVAKRQ